MLVKLLHHVLYLFSFFVTWKPWGAEPQNRNRAFMCDCQFSVSVSWDQGWFWCLEEKLPPVLTPTEVCTRRDQVKNTLNLSQPWLSVSRVAIFAACLCCFVWQWVVRSSIWEVGWWDAGWPSGVLWRPDWWSFHWNRLWCCLFSKS